MMAVYRVKFQKKQNLIKRILCTVFISLFIFLCLFSVVSVSAYADSETNNDNLNESIETLINELDLQDLQSYIDSLDDWKGEKVGERLLAYIKGEAFDYGNFLEKITEILFKNVRELLPAFACITAVCLLSGIISSLRSGGTAQTSMDMIFLISYISALIPLLSVLTECFQSATACVSSMQRQMQIVYPLLLTLMATSGGALSVAVCKPAVAFFSTNIVSLIANVVFPLTLTIIAFSMAGNLSSDLKISKFSAFFKSINKWIIGISISVFGIFFTLQGITTAHYDGIVRRATKYAIGNGVPIVGGFLSGGFDLAVASSVLIKNSLGSMSIFLMITVLFEPLTLLIAVNILLRFTSAITQPFGDSRISDFLGETAENLHYCTAGLLFTAFLYFLSIMLIVASSEALF